MKSKIKIILIELDHLSINRNFFAQTPNYTGTWVLNLEKSTLEDPPKGLTSTVFIIKQEGDKFRITIYHVFGDKKKKISFKMTADGKTRKVKILFKGKLEHIENVCGQHYGEKISQILSITNSGNSQNEFIADEVFKGKPQDHHSIWVFDREIPK
jgi:hypothetical protein